MPPSQSINRPLHCPSVTPSLSVNRPLLCSSIAPFSVSQPCPLICPSAIPPSLSVSHTPFSVRQPCPRLCPSAMPHSLSVSHTYLSVSRPLCLTIRRRHTQCVRLPPSLSLSLAKILSLRHLNARLLHSEIIHRGCMRPVANPPLSVHVNKLRSSNIGV